MRRHGFTLIELLLVIGIIAILASIVIVAINPTKQLANARNAQRRSDVNTVVNAVYQYAIDKNALPTGPAGEPIPTTTTGTWICKGNGTVYSGHCNSWSTGMVLNLLTGSYIVGMPVDPKVSPTTNTGWTGYKIGQNANNRITIYAPFAEQSETIQVSR